MSQVVVVGAGVGGLTTAALLARSGLEVAVLEAGLQHQMGTHHSSHMIRSTGNELPQSVWDNI